jgi:hypothetical protein
MTQIVGNGFVDAVPCILVDSSGNAYTGIATSGNYISPNSDATLNSLTLNASTNSLLTTQIVGNGYNGNLKVKAGPSGTVTIEASAGGGVSIIDAGGGILLSTGDGVVPASHFSAGTIGTATIMWSKMYAGSYISPAIIATGTYNVSINDTYVFVETSGVAAQINLPSGISGKEIVIKDKGSANTHNIIISGTSGQTIDGSLTQTINSAYGVKDIVFNGSGWYII